MRTIAAAILFAMVTVLTGVAHAAPLTATEGDIRLLQFLQETNAQFSGNGFSVLSSAAPGIDTTQAVGTGVVSIHTAFFNGILVSVQVGGASCTDDPLCGGTITLTSPRLPVLPDDWPAGVDFIATAPFTAVGQLTVGGENFDFVGSGTLQGRQCVVVVGGACVTPGPDLFYTFAAVPEPPTLLLLVAGLVGLVGLMGARTLRRV